MKQLIFFILLLSSVTVSSQIRVTGVYQGKNIYIQNPASGSGTYCAKRITVNGQSVIESVHANAFEIDLTIYGFELEDSIEIYITHSDDCLPKVLNPEVIGQVIYEEAPIQLVFGTKVSKEYLHDETMLSIASPGLELSPTGHLEEYWVITEKSEKHFKELVQTNRNLILAELYKNEDPPNFAIKRFPYHRNPTSKDTLIRYIDLPGQTVYYEYRLKKDVLEQLEQAEDKEQFIPVYPDHDILYTPSSDSNKILFSGRFINSKKEGFWNHYHKNGNLKSKIFFKNGLKQGVFVTYHVDGTIEELGQWYKSRFYGNHYTYNNNGSLYRTATYDENGRLIGLVRLYSEKNGNIEQIVTFQKGLENGFALQFDENSNLTRALYFSDGNRIDTLIVDSTELYSIAELAFIENKSANRKYELIDANKDIKKANVKAEEDEQQRFYLYGGLSIAILLIGLIFNRFRASNKQKKVIEKQKKIVDEAFIELGEKNQEILDSINYAKRIQSAILPSDKIVKEYLKKSFILYKPKDIVAGDFYWMEHKKDKVLFAAADCTGHGVPGAMVSVVCNNALNRSVREYSLTDPGEILDKTREIVINEFDKSEEDVKDGMDIALCSLEGNTLKYAGAHNPLWIIRNGSDTIEETKASKQPIGKFDLTSPYTTHTFELQNGDSVYIFSDGFVDQFGGPKGKKFKARAFRELLLSIQDIPMEEQSVLIDKAFEKWRGGIEQIDDVCVIGIRI